MWALHDGVVHTRLPPQHILRHDDCIMLAQQEVGQHESRDDMLEHMANFDMMAQAQHRFDMTCEESLAS